MKLDTSLAVEHVEPKKPEGVSVIIKERETDWNNFLLACTNCNSTKGDTNVALQDYFWPDRDNTFLALVYSEGGLITVNNNLPNEDLKEKAKKTISLTGLDKHPLNKPEASDRRWNNRREVWNIAKRSKERLARNNNSDFREQIVETATGYGYWSIWMTVFSDDADMLCRFIDALPGTCKQCFDQNNNYQAVSKTGGQI